jgi:hypothetical protein
MAPEVLVMGGVVLVIGSLIALAVAQYTHDWFFTPDLRRQVVNAHRPANGRDESRRNSQRQYNV